jgi:hypothetical protein
MRTRNLIGHMPGNIKDIGLKGGRISKTVTLAHLALKSYLTAAGIPSHTPAGNTFLCARSDSGYKVAESEHTKIPPSYAGSAIA